MVNVTNYFENMTGIGEMLKIPNVVTGGWFWLGMQVLIFIVLTVSLLEYGFETAILTASFICLISGMMLVYMELLSWQWLMFFLGIIIFIFVYITWNNRREG